jgi:hypothetical protein
MGASWGRDITLSCVRVGIVGKMVDGGVTVDSAVDEITTGP